MPNIDGQKVAELRKARSWTVGDLQAASGVSERRIYDIERANCTTNQLSVRPNTISSIASAFDVDPAHIICGVPRIQVSFPRKIDFRPLHPPLEDYPQWPDSTLMVTLDPIEIRVLPRDSEFFAWLTDVQLKIPILPKAQTLRCHGLVNLSEGGEGWLGGGRQWTGIEKNFAPFAVSNAPLQCSIMCCADHVNTSTWRDFLSALSSLPSELIKLTAVCFFDDDTIISTDIKLSATELNTYVRLARVERGRDPAWYLQAKVITDEK